MELLHNTIENRRHASDATGLSGCRPLRRDLKIWRALPRRRAKFGTVRRQYGAAPSCTAGLAPHGRAPVLRAGRLADRPGGRAFAVQRRGALLVPTGPRAEKPGHGAAGAPVTRVRAWSLPAARQTCVHLTAWDTNPVCVSGREMRCAMTAGTAGT